MDTTTKSRKAYPNIWQALLLLLLWLFFELILYCVLRVAHFKYAPELLSFTIGNLPILLVVIFALWRRKARISFLPFFKKQPFTLFIAYIVVNTSLTIVSMPIQTYLSRILHYHSRHHSTVYSAYTLVDIIFLAPILEEVLYRGIILDGFLKRYGPVFAIAASSLLFSLSHLDLLLGIHAFFGGLFTGWVYMRTRSLLHAIFIHSINNLASYFYRYLWAFIRMFKVSDRETVGWTICVLSLTLMILGIRWLHKKFNTMATEDYANSITKSS